MGIYEAVTVNREKGDKKPASRNIFRPIRLFGGELEEAFDLKEANEKGFK